MVVTYHAIQRAIERLGLADEDSALVELERHGRAVDAAAAIGCRVVRLGSGERLILDEDRIVTVYPKEAIPYQCRKA